MLACPNHPSEFEVRRCSRCGRSYCKNCLVLLQGSYYCADCKAERVRDVQSGTAGIGLEYASVGSRFLAIFIDMMVQACASWILLLPLIFLFGGLVAVFEPKSQPDPSAGMLVGIIALYALMFLVGLGIPVAYEGLMLSRGGQTLGKKALGLKVVTPDGNDISRGQAWGRAGMRLAVGFACALIDYIPAFFNDDKQCLHDMVASTRVIRL